ncbi:MAG: hypothetical protein HY692_01960, partial [Cyanobacteria bacterium NC_groundwater_1444_Ag_S-0.65um_54_12]|nr:hypothetical protein [Cyanobacteria bacterium NC_groundwater_1444_Ag_S-0.65um_54_12]
AGPAYTEVLGEIFLDLPMMRRFLENYSIRRTFTRQRLLQTLLNCYREWGSAKSPNIAIVDWREVPTYSEFELVCEYLQQQGIAAVIADPRELIYDGNRLKTADGFVIDLIYRRVLTNEFLAKISEVQAMLAAYRDHNVCVVNPFRSKLLHKKMLFGLLTAEDLQPLFSEAERNCIAAHIPWTRQLTPGYTFFAGERIDLLSWVAANRQQLVLKPNDEYGGKGIYIGWTMDDAAWSKAVAASVAKDYLVQEKVEVAYMDFPFFDGQTLRIERQLVDLDPYVFEGEVEGILTRLSGTELANVTAGAGIVPTFVMMHKE